MDGEAMPFIRSRIGERPGVMQARSYAAEPNTASILVFSVAALNGLTM
jgi:hypothetical protein